MKRSQLEKKYLKKRTQESFKKLQKSKKLLQQIIQTRDTNESLDSSKITDSKTFWKNSRPFFSEKRKTVNKITLVNENEDIRSNDKVVAYEINSYFQNATRNLGINENTSIAESSNDITDPADKASINLKLSQYSLNTKQSCK